MEILVRLQWLLRLDRPHHCALYLVGSSSREAPGSPFRCSPVRCPVEYCALLQESADYLVEIKGRVIIPRSNGDCIVIFASLSLYRGDSRNALFVSVTRFLPSPRAFDGSLSSSSFLPPTQPSNLASLFGLVVLSVFVLTVPIP